MNKVRLSVTEGEVRSSLRVILNNSDKKALNWAVNYAREGLEMYGKDLRVQCLYVLNNMTHWTGTVATEVRETLKAYAGVK